MPPRNRKESAPPAWFVGLCLLAGSASAQVPAGAVVTHQLPPYDAVAETPAAHELSPTQAAAINYAYGGYGYRPADHYRAGCAQEIRTHAIPSNTRHYGGYYVGGGVPYLGEGRYLGDGTDEGTFGWDYAGILFTKRVALNWTHGQRYQGGGGVYKTDGPKREHK